MDAGKYTYRMGYVPEYAKLSKRISGASSISPDNPRAHHAADPEIKDLAKTAIQSMIAMTNMIYMACMHRLGYKIADGDADPFEYRDLSE